MGGECDINPKNVNSVVVSSHPSRFPNRFEYQAGSLPQQMAAWPWRITVDGQNPAPPRMVIIPLFISSVLTIPGGSLDF